MVPSWHLGGVGIGVPLPVILTVLENLASSLDIPYNYLTASDRCSIQRANAHKEKQMNQITMSFITTAIAAALKAEEAGRKAEGQIKVAGIKVSEMFPDGKDSMGEADITAIKTAIRLGFNKDQQTLINAGKDDLKNWSDDKKKQRKSVQSKLSGYFIRLCDYAWPKVKEIKGESSADKAKADKADQWAKTLSTMLDQAQKLEGASFDLAGFVKALSVARSFVAIVK